MSTCLNLTINQGISHNCVNTDKLPVLLLTDNSINVTCKTHPPVTEGHVFSMIIYNSSHTPYRKCYNVNHCSIYDIVKEHSDVKQSCIWNTLEGHNIILGTIYLKSTKSTTTTSVPTLNTSPVLLRSLTEETLEWPWSQAHIEYTGTMGPLSGKGNLNLSTVVMHRNKVYLENECRWYKNEAYGQVSLLWETIGEEIKIGCRMINGSAHEKAYEISVYNLTSIPTADWDTTLCATERKLSR